MLNGSCGGLESGWGAKQRVQCLSRRCFEAHYFTWHVSGRKVIGQVKQPLSSPALHYSDFVKFLAGGLHLTTDHIIARD
jgi:hypothetical protein